MNMNNRQISCFLMSFIFIAGLAAQQSNLSLGVNYGRNDEVYLSVKNAGTNPAILYLFADGHYSSVENPIHNYDQQNMYDTEAHVAGRYLPTRPKKVTRSVSANVGSATNPVPYLGSDPIIVNESWAPAIDNEFFYIISYRNPTNSISGTYGTIELHLDDQVEVIGVYDGITDWNGPGSSLNTSSFQGCNKRIVWSYNNLAEGDVHHLYVQVEVPPNFSKAGVKSAITMESDFGVFSFSNESTAAVRRVPHDPNALEVNRDCLTSYVNQEQELVYTVHFQNSGDYYAEQVFVEVELRGNLEYSNIQIMDSSFPCTMSLSGDIVQFEFAEIQLPGSNQTYPYSYAYSQTTGFVTFSICSTPELIPERIISGVAAITFDEQAPIITNNTFVDINDECIIGNTCSGGILGTVGTSATGSFLNTLPGEGNEVDIFPNPTQSLLTATFELAGEEDQTVMIQLTDLNGRVVTTLMNEQRSPGVNQMEFNIEYLPKGVYFIHLDAGEMKSIQRIVKVD